MERYLIVFCFLIAVGIPFIRSSPPGHGGGGCACPLNYDPVCGTDGRTYGNLCELRCAYARLAYRGECRGGGEGCFCPQVYMPVCGLDGRTYGNGCELGCAGVGFAYEGECRSGGCNSVQCFVPPCLLASCPNYPSARCVPGCNCTARFIFRGRDVTRQCRRRYY